MRRTLSVRIHKSGDYTQILDGSSGNHVRLLYAVPIGSDLIPGGSVPGQGFTYVGEGVWEREVNTSLINSKRTDYYYLEYSDDGGETWTGVAGYDPFFFNMKISTDMESPRMQPRIADKTPGSLVFEENAVSLEVSFDGAYTSGDKVNASHIRRFTYKYETGGSGEITIYGNSISIPRTGDDDKAGKSIGVSLNIINNDTGEMSETASGQHVFGMESISEILNTGKPSAPAAMRGGDVSESSVLGINDSFTVQMPPLDSRSQHSELAIQYGGVPFTIREGVGLEGFTGTVMLCHANTLTIPKPLFFSSGQDVYFARRIVGYNDSSIWVGDTTTTALTVNMKAPEKHPIMSDNIIEGIVDAVIAKVETSGGETIARKINLHVNS